jgi:hypothetical protein
LQQFRGARTPPVRHLDYTPCPRIEGNAQQGACKRADPVSREDRLADFICQVPIEKSVIYPWHSDSRRIDLKPIAHARLKRARRYNKVRGGHHTQVMLQDGTIQPKNISDAMDESGFGGCLVA